MFSFKKNSCGRCGMKFAIAQEVSRHVRDKLCKFYNTNQSTTCTITSNEGVKEAVDTVMKNAETSTSQKTFALITSDSIKFTSIDGDDKVTVVEESPSQGLDLIENNFTEILSPSAFQINVSTNETVLEEDVEEDDNEFGMIIGEIDSNDGQVVEIVFKCRICSFR